MELEFTNLNGFSNLTYLEASTPSELEKMIKSIRVPLGLITIYFDGTKHIAWVRGNFKKKIKKEK